MNTILIAEDEKFIRLGLKAMIRRSPLPVGEILEARDGEEAMALLRTHTVDLLITDIRMPRMDGIQLVSQLGTMGERPMVLVISGYDDFSYAVEMLRNGVQDYLLKPVERERLYEIMEKLEDRFQARQSARKDQEHQYLHALRQLMLEQDTQSEAWREQVRRYGGSFFAGAYVGICAGECELPLPDGALRLHAVGPLSLYVAPAAEQDSLSAVLAGPKGYSAVHRGLESLRTCYQQAHGAWRRSFFTGEPCQGPVQQEDRPLAATPQQLVGLVGLSRGAEVSRLLAGQAERVGRGEADPEELARLCADFVGQLYSVYRNLIDAEDEPGRFACLWDFGSWDQYLRELDSWLEGFCGRVNLEFSDYENKQKIRQAVQYIQQHFQEPLNMAVVSNHVSMNYSLFSLLFKQYTGTNFVSYLQKLRIEEAKRLLEATDWRVNEIGRRVGFADEKHFLKVFKAATGFSPTEYRKSTLLLQRTGQEDKA